MGNHRKWIQRRIIMDQELQSCNLFESIELPRPIDILLGKGKPCQSHAGNCRLLELAELYLDEYDQANPHGGRTIVARKIIWEVLHPSSNGQQEDKIDRTEGDRGRFLQRRQDQLNSGWWEEVTNKQVMIAKASYTLRYIRKRNIIVAGQVRLRPG
jgi:hypothetical protein